MWPVPICNGQNIGAVPSHLDAQKHLDDPLHSAEKASSSLSEWRLSYNHIQCRCRRLQPLVDSEQTTANNRYLAHLWSDFSCQLTDIYASHIVPSSKTTKFHDKFTKVMGMVKKYNEDIGIICMNQDLRCVLWCPWRMIEEQISGQDSWRWCWCLHSTFSPCSLPLWLCHWAWCMWQEQPEMHKYQWFGKQNWITAEWDFYLL